MGSKTDNPTPERRKPVQARSRQRYERIVDVAAAQFAAQGIDATTMEGIAAEAETSIGSLYQFFPNKLALFHAVGERAIQRNTAAFAEALGPEVLSRPWTEVVDAALDIIMELNRKDPAILAVSRNLQVYDEIAEEDAAVTRAFIARVEEVFAHFARPDIDKRTRRAVATMIVNVVTATAFFTRTASDRASREQQRELKRMLRAYLAVYVDEA